MTNQYIEREAAKRELLSWAVCMNHPEYLMRDDAMHVIDSMPAADVECCGRLRGVTYEDGKVTAVYIRDTDDAVKVFAPVWHGRWILQANNERTNYRWNVTAECSECCDEVKEIWAGFFHNVPDWLARDVALESAKSVKLSNYCPNCGARMDGAE